MSKIPRMSPAELKELRDLHAALQVLPGYNPHDTNATVEALGLLLGTWDGSNTVEVQKENEVSAARDATALVEKALRAMRTTIHTQVGSQYGKDSNQYASLGLKKTSEYKKRGPRAT